MRPSLQKKVASLCIAIATGGYLSFLPGWIRRGHKNTGAGLIGTALGLLAIRALPLSPLPAFTSLVGFLLMSVAISDIAEERLGIADDPRIIIDEFVGFWVAMFLLPHSWPWLTAAFVLFRIFDVCKWGWIARSAEWPGGWGIVMDDVVAGIFANLILRTVYVSSHFVHG